MCSRLPLLLLLMMRACTAASGCCAAVFIRWLAHTGLHPPSWLLVSKSPWYSELGLEQRCRGEGGRQAGEQEVRSQGATISGTRGHAHVGNVGMPRPCSTLMLPQQRQALQPHVGTLLLGAPRGGASVGGGAAQAGQQPIAGRPAPQGPKGSNQSLEQVPVAQWPRHRTSLCCCC